MFLDELFNRRHVREGKRGDESADETLGIATQFIRKEYAHIFADKRPCIIRRVKTPATRITHPLQPLLDRTPLRRSRCPVLLVDQHSGIETGAVGNETSHHVRRLPSHDFDRESESDRSPQAFGVLKDQRDIAPRVLPNERVVVELAKTISGKAALRSLTALTRRTVESVEPGRTARHHRLDQVDDRRLSRSILPEYRGIAGQIQIGAHHEMPVEENNSSEFDHDAASPITGAPSSWGIVTAPERSASRDATKSSPATVATSARMSRAMSCSSVSNTPSHTSARFSSISSTSRNAPGARPARRVPATIS
ncbi:hypothetical protein BIBO2_3124 [Brucella sp. BO2]|nr:hypothetical protein BIBO2_3124 [Brucella sp. BO2]